MEKPSRRVLLIAGLTMVPVACGGDDDASTTRAVGTAVPCSQKAGADQDADCAGHARKPRKLDCSGEETQAALNAGCEPTAPGESDVCCPLSVRGVLEDNAGGSVTVPCEQKSDADGNPDCAGHSGKSRKLDCDPAQTQSAVNAGCEPTSAGESDVCCPTTVSGAAVQP